MAVTKADYGRYHTLVGTLPEVAASLNDEVVPAEKVVAVFHNGTAYVAVYHK